MSASRAAAIRKAQQELALQPVYLDTETTGLQANDQIVELCILDAQGEALVDSLVRPTAPIPFVVTRIHGITNAMVRDAPTWAELWLTVAPLLVSYRIAIYNAEFDLRLMQQTHQLYGLNWPGNLLSSVCIMQLYAQYVGQRGSHGYFKMHSLSKALQQCQIQPPSESAHRAHADALASRALLHYLAAQPV
jgi:DNA polymerase-3 subunit epsilon